jgi:hypothetical protein
MPVATVEPTARERRVLSKLWLGEGRLPPVQGPARPQTPDHGSLSPGQPAVPPTSPPSIGWLLVVTATHGGRAVAILIGQLTGDALAQDVEMTHQLGQRAGGTHGRVLGAGGFKQGENLKLLGVG